MSNHNTFDQRSGALRRENPIPMPGDLKLSALDQSALHQGSGTHCGARFDSIKPSRNGALTEPQRNSDGNLTEPHWRIKLE